MPQDPAPAERERAAALRRTKLLATGVLLACFVVFVLARAFESTWPVLGAVAAFAEAATIGGLADWYAVVALFKRPLGLPIPHTAIIPANQDRIADNLGKFIEVNFLAPGPVRAKLAEVDYAALVAEWLSDPQRAKGLSAFVARLVPQALDSIEGSGLRGFAGDRLREQVAKIDVAPLAADLLTAFTADRRHQKLFDQIIKVLGAMLGDEDTVTSLREKIRAELPSLFNMFKADAYLLKKIVGSASSLLEDVRADPDHPMRAEFDQFVQGFVQRLRTSKEYRKRAEKLKNDFLDRPELAALTDNLWRGFRDFVEKDAAADDSRIRVHLASMFVEAGRHLATDPQLRADMNDGFVVALASFVETQKSGVSGFIADQVKRWDLALLVRQVELNVGRDLQYIRFNGMLIGGLAGLVLYGIGLMLKV